MIYARFLLWALIAPFKLTLQVPQVLPDHEINGESKGEFISEISINITSYGLNSKYILQSSEGFFVGERTKIWTLKNNRNRFQYFLKRNIMGQVNISFHRDEKTWSPISHTVNKRGVSDFNDTIDTSHNGYIEVSKPIHIESIMPKIVYPQILVFVDRTLYLHFQRNAVRTVSYVITLLNGVDLYFREITEPIIRLNIAAIVLCENSMGILDDDDINSNTWDKFSKFMYNNTKFRLNRDYDIAVLLVKPKTKFYNSNDLSRTGTICQQGLNGIDSVAIINDYGLFEGIRIGARELGHVFGSSYYDSKDLNKEGDRECPFWVGRLTSNYQNRENKFYFSSCFSREIAYYLSEAKCILNNPAVNRTDHQILTILPGQFMSADEQCHLSGQNRTALVTPDMCSELICMSMGLKFILDKPALEGTPCDFGRICLRGECVKIPYEDSNTNLFLNNLNLKHYLPPQNNKTLKEQCKEKGITSAVNATLNDCELACVYNDKNGQQHVRNLYAQDGTMCKDYGFCRDTICIDEHFLIANEHCIKSGYKGFNKMNGECSFICKEMSKLILDDLYMPYREPTKKLYIISAPNGFSCSNNGYCQEEKCINMTSTTSTTTTTSTHRITDSIQRTVRHSGSSTSLHKPVIFLPRIERCREMKMNLSKIKMECRFLCFNYIENEDSESSEDTVEKLIYDENGFPCHNFGYCLDGECVNMTSDNGKSGRTLSEKCKDLGMDLSDNFNDGCMAYCKNETEKYDVEVVADDGYRCLDNKVCHDGVCVEEKVISVTPASTVRTTPLIRSIDEFDSPRKRCEKLHYFVSYKNTDPCKIMCTSKNELELLSILRPKMDNENIQTVFLSAENGYPCETNKHCLDEKCVFNGERN